MGSVPKAALSCRLALLAPLLAALLATGCVVTEGSLCFWHTPGEKPCQLVCIWQNHVMTVPDSANNGVPTQGFAGRVYLFGQNMDYPLSARGTLIVDLIDETYDPKKWVERWIFDPDTLQRLKKQDIMGMGYTVYLPSKEYRPDMTKIRLKASFQEADAAPLYTENVVTLSPLDFSMRDSHTPMNLPAMQPTKTTFKPAIPIR